jgi:hypothetical protein
MSRHAGPRPTPLGQRDARTPMMIDARTPMMINARTPMILSARLEFACALSGYFASSAGRNTAPAGRGFKRQDRRCIKRMRDSKRPLVAIGSRLDLSASASTSAPSMIAGAQPRPERGLRLLLRVAACARSRCMLDAWLSCSRCRGRIRRGTAPSRAGGAHKTRLFAPRLIHTNESG